MREFIWHYKALFKEVYNVVPLHPALGNTTFSNQIFTLGKTGSFTGSDGVPKSNRKGKVKEKNERNKQASNDQEKDENEKDFDINQFFVSDDFLQFSDVVRYQL